MVSNTVSLRHFGLEDYHYRVSNKSPCIIDGKHWYEIWCSPEVANWIINTFQNQKNTSWYDYYTTNYFKHFDVNEEIMTLMALRWAQ
jgi:hypothetical protein